MNFQAHRAVAPLHPGGASEFWRSHRRPEYKYLRGDSPQARFAHEKARGARMDDDAARAWLDLFGCCGVGRGTQWKRGDFEDSAEDAPAKPAKQDAVRRGCVQRTLPRDAAKSSPLSTVHSEFAAESAGIAHGAEKTACARLTRDTHKSSVSPSRTRSPSPSSKRFLESPWHLHGARHDHKEASWLPWFHVKKPFYIRAD